MDENELRRLIKENPDLADLNPAVAEQGKKRKNAAIAESLGVPFDPEQTDANKQLREKHKVNWSVEMASQLNAAGPKMGWPEAVTEYKLPGFGKRRFRIDVAMPEWRVAIEIEGGIYLSTSTGRSKGHAHPKRFLSDMVKYRLISRARWFLFRFSPEEVKSGDAFSYMCDVFFDWEHLSPPWDE